MPPIDRAASLARLAQLVHIDPLDLSSTVDSEAEADSSTSAQSFAPPISRTAPSTSPTRSRTRGQNRVSVVAEGGKKSVSFKLGQELVEERTRRQQAEEAAQKVKIRERSGIW